MYDVIRFAQDILNRGESLTPRECMICAACLTLACYVVLLVSGRTR
ncbi:MAG: hypothetical protein KY475_24270 [Planctomycetes bacterium]|nr:hypothetical protein [Planctomycetota bacterium]